MNEVVTRNGRVTIAQAEAYLSKQNWTRDGNIRNIATVWHRPDSETAEVVLPSTVELRDYAQRMRDVVQAIAEYEGRSELDVSRSILNLFSSFISVRVVARDTENGTIPIDDGVLLVTKARELLTAAAMSMFSKRRLYTGKPPKDAVSYIDSLLLGQTEVGSYVVNVIAPTQDAVAQDSVKGAEPVEGVALSLARSLDALTQAASRYEETSDPSVFERSVSQGVSANMCDALLGFAGEKQNRQFEVKILGASGPMFDGELRVFDFQADQVETLKAASSYFKDDYILPDRMIVGLVKKLHRKIEADVGTITVEATVNDAVKSVQIDLGPAEYHEAVMAHDKKIWVQCYGDVHVKHRTTRLLNPTQFKIIEAADLF